MAAKNRRRPAIFSVRALGALNYFSRLFRAGLFFSFYR
jgi:hypothetical protein